MVQPSQKCALYVACLVGIAAPRAYCAEWSTSAGITPGIVFTDNVCLSADDEESDIYATATPSFSVQGAGNNANVSLSTSVDLNSLSDGDLRSNNCGSGDQDRDRERYLPSLNARGDAVLIDQWLFIDGNATSSQNSVSSFASGGDDRADRTGNTNTTYRYSVSPYISRRFKNAGDLYLRYTYDDQYNTKDIVGDSSKNSANLLLSSGARLSPISVSLQGDYSKVTYSDTESTVNDDSELKSAQINGAYQYNRTWAINGYVGDEWNDFVSTRDDIDGAYWGAGLTWTPTSRTSVDIGTGDRYFGSTPWLRVSHRHKRSSFSANYEKTLTYSRDVRTLGADGSIDDPLNDTTLSNSPILDERLTVLYAFNGRRMNIGVNGSYSDQTRERGGDLSQQELDLSESTFKQVSVSVGHPLAKSMSLSTRLSWSEQEPKGERSQSVASSETWALTVGASRPLNDRTNVSINYKYTDRQSDSSLNEYQENRITLNVRFNLL